MIRLCDAASNGAWASCSAKMLPVLSRAKTATVGIGIRTKIRANRVLFALNSERVEATVNVPQRGRLEDGMPFYGKLTLQAESYFLPTGTRRRSSSKKFSRKISGLCACCASCDSAGMSAAILAPSCASQGKRDDHGQSPVNVTWTCRRLAGVPSGLGRADRGRTPDRLIHYPFG